MNNKRNLKGETIQPPLPDILSLQEVEKAKQYYFSNSEEVHNTILQQEGTNKYPPFGEVFFEQQLRVFPGFWKAQHWRWFIDKFIK